MSLTIMMALAFGLAGIVAGVQCRSRLPLSYRGGGRGAYGIDVVLPDNCGIAVVQHHRIRITSLPRLPASSAFPPPVVAKTLTMPADHCRRLHNLGDACPFGPIATQHDPKQTIGIRQLSSGTTKFQCCQLLPQRQIFKCQLTVAQAPKSAGRIDSNAACNCCLNVIHYPGYRQRDDSIYTWRADPLGEIVLIGGPRRHHQSFARLTHRPVNPLVRSALGIQQVNASRVSCSVPKGFASSMLCD